MSDRKFTVASWNVEHFKGDPERVERVVGFIQGEAGGPPAVPDVFALYEVEGRDVYEAFMRAFPDHSFHLTEGKQTQEILVGVHYRLQSFVTQRLEFKTQRDWQRPGLFLTVHQGEKDYSLLFLHIRSGRTPEDFGLRDTAVAHAFSLKRALDEAQSCRSNFVFLGDLNTMGIDDTAPYSNVLDQTADEELDRLGRWAERRDMRLLPKTHRATWWNGSGGYDPIDLDHVIGSSQLDVRRLGGEETGVSVLGWPRLETREERLDWIEGYSDHAMVGFEVWGG